MTDPYTDSPHHPFPFRPEPEPEPPTLANGTTDGPANSPTNKGPPAGGTEPNSSSHPPPSRTWTSLTLPGALLNTTIYILGRTIELLLPYIPTSTQRRALRAWADAHPVLTSFLLLETLFILVPVVAFAAFVAALAVLVVGAAVLLVVGIGLGVGVMVFIPGVLVAAGWAAVVWAWAYVAVRAAWGAWGVYRRSPYYQQLSSGEGGGNGGKKAGKQPPPQPLWSGYGYAPVAPVGVVGVVGVGYEEGEKRPTSPSSEASSTVKVEDRDGDAGAGAGAKSGGGDVQVEKLRDVYTAEGNRDEDRVGRDIQRSLG